MEFLYSIEVMLISIQIRFLYIEDVKITKATTNIISKRDKKIGKKSNSLQKNIKHERRQKCLEEVRDKIYKIYSKRTKLSSLLLAITLNVNQLNSTIKWQTLDEWIFKKIIQLYAKSYLI